VAITSVTLAFSLCQGGNSDYVQSCGTLTEVIFSARFNNFVEALFLGTGVVALFERRYGVLFSMQAGIQTVAVTYIVATLQRGAKQTATQYRARHLSISARQVSDCHIDL
jgi:hypothetical protein